jgi:two-component system NtrC family sensor kinase
MQTGQHRVLDGSSPPADSGFQQLLLEISAGATKGVSSSHLIQTFCRRARQFFQTDGVYFWQASSAEELIGAEADGHMAAEFRGMRMRAGESAVTMEAIRQRKTIYSNRIESRHYRTASEFHAKSLMAAPLIVYGEVIGAATFLHASEPDFFDDDLAAKATILAGQLGSLLEASRLNEASQEEVRRAKILAEVVQNLHKIPDAGTALDALADRLRLLVRGELVCIMMRQGSAFELRAVSAETLEKSDLVRARHDRKGLLFSADLARRAIAAGTPISVSIDPATHTLGELVPAGVLLAIPFRTSSNEGAILVYPRSEGPFRSEEKSLIYTLASFGAMAIANAELYTTARSRAHELHQLLDISFELRSIGELDQFLQQFALRAADFLGFGRAFIGLLENGAFHVRWGAEEGHSKSVEVVVPDGPLNQALLRKEVFSADEPGKLPGANLEHLSAFHIKQILAVPLLGTGGNVLGMFGVLDKLDGATIAAEDVRRASALAAQVAVALEVTRNLHTSEQHRQRAESLMSLALALNGMLRLPEFVAGFANRAISVMDAQKGALIVHRDGDWEVTLVPSDAAARLNGAQRDNICQAMAKCFDGRSEPIVTGSSKDLVGSDLASVLDWNTLKLTRLTDRSGEVLGILCLADRERSLSQEDEQLFQAVAGHGAVALENARLFARMDQANRHWVEIFDSIEDFIVAHDHLNNVLRVNRSLAEFIGVQPQELIRVAMGTLFAVRGSLPLHACPFCRIAGDGKDEYVHPVLDRTYLVSTFRVHSANSEGLQTIHILKDITDRREAERRYREIFDNIQEGLFFAAADGRFIEVNDTLVRMLGYSNREDLLHADVRSQIYVSSDSHSKLMSQMQLYGGVRGYEETLRRRDGGLVHVLINSFAVRDGQGQVVQYRGLMLDISGLKNFQSELQRERDFSGKILNNTQSLILVADTAGLVSYANRRWYDLGFEQNGVLGRPLQDLVAGPSRSILLEAFSATLEGRQVDNVDLQILRSDGRTGQFSVNFSPMRDEQGNVASIVVVMSDVTDAANLQAKLMHAEKMAAVGQLVSGVAHEVNNPLTAILGFADLLLENPEIPDSARKDLRVILQEAQRTKQIVQNLLSFARQMPPQRKPVQLNTILRRTVQLRAYDLHSRGVEVMEHLDEELPYVIGDAQQLQQVFLNIMNNAYDAIRETGRPARIEIMTARMPNFVEVSFRDNGVGISDPERIFDPFYTTKEVGKGTGLGLSICYGIVREHGGEISCRNNAGAQGATFIVRLPSATNELASLAAGGKQP